MASVSFLNSLKKGQILKAKIEEIQSSQLLCNFQGELLLVGNHSSKKFDKDQTVLLQVTHLHPIQLQIFSDKNSFERVI